jgi:large subunit ribosomal protein L21
MPTKGAVTKEKPKVVKKDKPSVSVASSPKSSTDFAVFTTGGKQYKVSVGDTIIIEKIVGEYKEGDKITFDKVLLQDDGTVSTIGTPYITGSKVMATLIKIGRGKKIIVIKYKQKSRYFKKNGHRQPFFQVRIDSIN